MKNSCRNHIKKTAWNTTAFSWFLVPNGSPKQPQNLSLFCSGKPLGHTLALKWPRWHPGADFASKYVVLSGILYDFWMVFTIFLHCIRSRNFRKRPLGARPSILGTAGLGTFRYNPFWLFARLFTIINIIMFNITNWLFHYSYLVQHIILLLVEPQNAQNEPLGTLLKSLFHQG